MSTFTRLSPAAIIAASMLACSQVASAAPIVVDPFTDQFESENFVVDGNTDGTIDDIVSVPGLEIGDLLLPISPTNDEIGEPTPATTNRISEYQYQGNVPSILAGGDRETYYSIREDGSGTLTMDDSAGTVTLTNVGSYELNQRGMSNLDVTDGGTNTHVEFDILYSDLGLNGFGFRFQVGMSSGLGESHFFDSGFLLAIIGSFSEQELLDIGYPQSYLDFFDVIDPEPYTVSIPLSEFEANGVDITSIEDVYFLLDHGRNGIGSTTVSSIRFVPAPASTALFAPLALMATRRRR